MKVEEFVTNWKMAKDKDKFINDSIKTKYVPFLDKLVICTSVVKATSYTGDIFKVNSPNQFLLYTVKLIGAYTKIEFDADRLAENYDSLNSHGLIAALVSAIPESETTEFTTLLNMVKDDLYENTRSVASITDGLRLVFGAIGETFSEVLTKENIDKITERLTADK